MLERSLFPLMGIAFVIVVTFFQTHLFTYFSAQFTVRVLEKSRQWPKCARIFKKINCTNLLTLESLTVKRLNKTTAEHQIQKEIII